MPQTIAIMKKLTQATWYEFTMSNCTSCECVRTRAYERRRE